MAREQLRDTGREKSSFVTRALSMLALTGVVGGAIAIGGTAYRAFTDSFVAPIILSPDSDMVIQSKVGMSHLVAERMRLVAVSEQIDSDVEAATDGIGRLAALKATASKALEWTTAVVGKQASAGERDMRALARQRDVLAAMVAGQEKRVSESAHNAEVGLVTAVDHAREVQTLEQMRVAALENERARLTSEVQMHQVGLAQKALSGGATGTLAPTPEMLLHQDHLVRIELELLRLEAERRTKQAEKKHNAEELAKIDELLAQMKARPIFRAMEAPMDVAFVPYTQLEGVRGGAEVYDCVWGIFACVRVGKVSELLQGEVILPDPWGTPSRGLYAILSLDDREAARSKTLRVRGDGLHSVTRAALGTERVSASGR